MSLIRNSAYAAGAAVTLAACRFGVTAIVGHSVPAEMFGHFVYVQWLIDLVVLISGFGFTGAASRYLAENRNDSEKIIGFLHRWRPWAFGLPLAGGAIAVTTCVASNLSFSLPAWTAIVTWTFAAGLWSMQTAALTGFQRFDLIFRANVLGGFIIVGGAFSVRSSQNLTLLLVVMAVGAVVGALTGVRTVMAPLARRVSHTLASELRALRGYGLNTWIISIVGVLLWTRGELPIVRVYLGDSGVAEYAAASTLFAGTVQCMSLGIAAVVPQLTRLWGEGNVKQAIHTARDVSDLQLLLAGLGAVALIQLGPQIIGLVFGARYVHASDDLAVLSIALGAMVLNGQNHMLQLSTGGVFTRNLSLIGVVLLGLLAFLLIPFFGIKGAVCARVITTLSLAATSFYFYRKEWGREALNGMNFCRVAGVLLLNLVGLWNFGHISTFLSVTLFVFSAAFLIFSVRDAADKPKVFFLSGLLVANLRRPNGSFNRDLS